MALQMILDSLEGVDENITQLYVEKEGKFHLDVDGHDKNDDSNRIPKQRLDAEITKRKASDDALTDIAKGFEESIPEEMRELIPDLPPAQKIKWIQNANAKGLFEQKAPEGIDTKRPKGKTPTDFENMSPATMMAMGYKK